MRSSLEEFLRERAGLAPEQIRDARRAQTFFGGSLLSNLVRLDFLRESQAVAHLSEWTGFPHVTLGELRNIPADVTALLDRRTAARRQVVPFRVDDGRLLVVTCRADNDPFYRSLEDRTGLKVVPHAALDDRIEILLQRHYGIVPQGRAGLRPVAGEADPFAEVPAAHAATASVDHAPAGEGVGLDGLPLAAEAGVVAEEARHLDLWESVTDSPRTAGPPVAGRPLTMETDEPGHRDGGPDEPPSIPLQTLSAAEDRTRIGRAALELALAAGAVRAVLFSIQKDHVLAWDGRGTGVEAAGLARLNIPLYAPSIFGVFAHSTRPWVGIVPELPANREVLAALGGVAPKVALLVPVLLRGRTVALLYVDRGPEAVEPLPMTPFLDISGRLSFALEILLLRRKILS
jgi:type II secretion system (T2SS) protein E